MLNPNVIPSHYKIKGTRDFYFDGGGNHNIYGNAALTDATARTISVYVLDSTADAWMESLRFTPDAADPWTSFGYKVHVGAHTEPTNMFKVTGDLDVTDNVGIGVTTWGTSAAKVLGIGNGTAPTTSPADMVQVWAEDWSAGDARLNIQGELTRGWQIIGAEGMELHRASANADGPVLYGVKSRGTKATRTAVSASDVLLSLNAYGYDSNNASAGTGYLTAKAIGTIGAARVPNSWEVHCYSDVATPVDTTVMTFTAASVLAQIGVRIGADSTNNLIDDASTGSGSTTLYIGNKAILVANGVNFGPAGVVSITVVDGQITAIS